MQLPIRLSIPRIHVDAAIEIVGITAGGAMDVPKSPDTVAWFGLGPKPGEVGSAVIAGHYGWKNGMPAVFDDLHMLRSGDKIYVKNREGIVTTFVVRELRSYADDAVVVTGVFDSADGKAHLNLITCGGIWNKELKSYSQRTIVFADKVME